MTERKIYQRLKPFIEKNLGKSYRIETGSTISGIPDVYYAFKNYSGWIEIKIDKGKNKINIPYRPGQIPWLREHCKLNRNTFVLLYREQSLRYFLINEQFNRKFPNAFELTKISVWNGRDFDFDFINTLKGII